MQVAMGKTERQIIKAEELHGFLGPQKYFSEMAERVNIPGVAIGLAWTPTGGDVLFIEASRMPGGKKLNLTGKLGEVMNESAQAAFSYIRSRTHELGIDDDFFDKSDIHVHVPAGAIPKDGPSAGITLATAIASLLTNRPVVPDMAMTGEITLRGKVLPVGGIKEKVLAAARHGLARVILPSRNEKDLEEIPAEVRKRLQFIFVDDMEKVVKVALGEKMVEDKRPKPPKPQPKKNAPPKTSPPPTT
jgi:ATP-dependent Lon protease